MFNFKSRQTVAEYYKEWLLWAKKGQISAVTYQRYEIISKTLDQYATMPLAKFTRQDYQNLLTLYGQTHTYATCNIFRQMLNQALRDAVYDGLIKKDPTYKVKAVSSLDTIDKTNYLEYDDAQKLLQFLLNENTAKSRFCAFGLLTGCRFAEILGITKSDLNLQNKTIKINKTYNYKSQSGFLPTKNSSSNRIIAINSETRQILPKLNTKKPIFVNDLLKECKNIHNSVINHYLKRTCQKLKIRSITFHGLRHTHASILIAQGVSLQAVAKRLGHANTIVTQRIYIHLLKEQEAKDNLQIMRALNFKQQHLNQIMSKRAITLLRQKIAKLSPYFATKLTNNLLITYHKQKFLYLFNDTGTLKTELIANVTPFVFNKDKLNLVTQLFDLLKAY